MDKYVDLGISFFDPEFTLNPHRWLADLYPRKEIMGFCSEGMNFAFRLQDCREIMLSRHCTRALESHADKEREAAYAVQYPNRTRHFSLSYLHGEFDMALKVLLTRLISGLVEQASFAPVERVVQPLGKSGLLPDFVNTIARLPLRMFLDTCRLPYDEEQLASLHTAGFDFLKALENFSDEDAIARADAGILLLGNYLSEACTRLDDDSLIGEFMREGRKLGLSDEQLRSNLTGNFLAALSNTMGMSSAFILRTLAQDKGALKTLKAQPELLRSDSTITELLRRDSHVKAMSRYAHEPVPLNGFTLERGENIMLFFPGINGDPAHWGDPHQLNFRRDFSGDSNVVFGGALYSCIGRKLTLAFLKVIVSGFVQYLPLDACIDDADIEVDGSWVAERIISKMPVRLS